MRGRMGSKVDEVKQDQRDMLLSSSPPNFVNFNSKKHFSSGDHKAARNLEEKFNTLGVDPSSEELSVQNTAEKRAQGTGGIASAVNGNESPPGLYKEYNNEPFVIGVAGGTASGKTTVCNEIIQRLSNQRVVIIAQDSFYRGLTKEEEENVSEYNFDHPDAFDKNALLECIHQLKKRQSVHIPIYDFKTHQRSAETKLVNPGEVVIVEGIMVLHMEEVRKELNMKIFVDTDDDLRLARRIKRDTISRGRDVDNVIAQYTKFVKPMFDQFISPSKRFADVIIPCGRDVNHVAIDLITQHVHVKLDQRISGGSIPTSTSSTPPSRPRPCTQSSETRTRASRTLCFTRTD